MKLNVTPRHYMPLSQNQSDDDESGPSKEEKGDKLSFKGSLEVPTCIAKVIGQSDEICLKNRPMSPLRILMLILSQMLCILLIVLFVFFLPCNKPNNLNGTCRLTNKWKTVFYNMSFTSPLNFIKGYAQKSVIIFGYVKEEVGLIGIDGSNGKEMWRIPLHGHPSSSVCDILDVNSDNKPDCLVTGSNSLFTAIDVRKGISLWYLHNHSDLSDADTIDGATIMPDCDGDGIYDVAISYNISKKKTVFLALVSGGTGQVIGSLVELYQCKGPITTRFSWNSGNETEFVLHCMAEKDGNLWYTSSKSICEIAKKKSQKLTMKNIFSVPHFVKDIHFYKVSVTDNHIVIILDGVQFMLLEKLHCGFQIIWKIYMKEYHKLRILSDGEFSQNFYQLALSSNSVNHSKVIGIGLNNGKQMWSFDVYNRSIISAVKLRKFFGVADGLVVKTVSDSSYLEAREMGIENYERSTLKKGLKLIDESFLLVKCGKTPVLKTICSEKILSYCNEATCKPDIYSANKSVLAHREGLDASFDMLTVSSTLYQTNSSIKPVEAIIVKSFNLENVLSLPICVG